MGAQEMPLNGPEEMNNHAQAGEQNKQPENKDALPITKEQKKQDKKNKNKPKKSAEKTKEQKVADGKKKKPEEKKIPPKKLKPKPMTADELTIAMFPLKLWMAVTQLMQSEKLTEITVPIVSSTGIKNAKLSISLESKEYKVKPKIGQEWIYIESATYTKGEKIPRYLKFSKVNDKLLKINKVDPFTVDLISDIGVLK